MAQFLLNALALKCEMSVSSLKATIENKTRSMKRCDSNRLDSSEGAVCGPHDVRLYERDFLKPQIYVSVFLAVRDGAPYCCRVQE